MSRDVSQYSPPLAQNTWFAPFQTCSYRDCARRLTSVQMYVQRVFVYCVHMVRRCAMLSTAPVARFFTDIICHVPDIACGEICARASVAVAAMIASRIIFDISNQALSDLYRSKLLFLNPAR